jgi:hypothetical protein
MNRNVALAHSLKNETTKNGFSQINIKAQFSNIGNCLKLKYDFKVLQNIDLQSLKNIKH